jgi:FAD:protein FMN transferase
MKWPPLLTPFASRPRRRQRHFEGVLGTALELQIQADTEAQLDTAEAALLAELDRLEQLFSRFLPGSELNRLQARQGLPTTVSTDFAALLSRAEHFMTLTGGAFHPAADTLARLWQTGEPDCATLNDVLEQMQRPLWTLNGQQVTLHTPLSLNFNALAKGFITDAAAQAALNVPGVRQVMLNIGGDVRHLGQGSVSVGLEAAGQWADNRPPVGFVTLNNQAVTTSGQTYRGAHLFDPRTGQPTSAGRTVSVIAPNCADSDALSTAFCVLDIPDCLALANRLEGVGVLIHEGESSSSTPYWQQRRQR